MPIGTIGPISLLRSLRRQGVLDITVHGVTFPLYTLVELSHCTLADAFPLSDEEVRIIGVLENTFLESCRDSPPRVLLQARGFARQILGAVKFLHDNDVVHR